MASFQLANHPSFSSGVSLGPCGSRLLHCPPPLARTALPAPAPTSLLPSHTRRTPRALALLCPCPGASPNVSAHGWHYRLLQEAFPAAVLPTPHRPQASHVTTAWSSSSTPSWRHRAGSDNPSPEEGRAGGPWTVLGRVWGNALFQT